MIGREAMRKRLIESMGIEVIEVNYSDLGATREMLRETLAGVWECR